MTCPNCGYRPPQGRPRLYDVGDMDVGDKRAFDYRDHHQRSSIRNTVKQFGYRNGMEFETYAGRGNQLIVERTY